MDGDIAGLRASLRAAELALPLLVSGKSLRFTLLPAGEDPDSLIIKHGLAYVENLLMQAKDIYEILWQAAAREYSGRSPSARSGLEKKAMEYAALIQDPVLRGHARSFFKEKLWERPKKSGVTPQAPSSAALRSPESSDVDRQALKLLLQHPALLHDPNAEAVLMSIDSRLNEESQLQACLLEFIHTDSADTPLFDFLRQQGVGEYAARLLALPAHGMDDVQKARKWLQNLHDGLYVRTLEEEYRRLEHECQGEGMDSAYPRLLALQQEIQQHHTRRMLAFLEE